MWRALEVSAQTVALLTLDLDGFKQVNDTYGHAVGDHLLAALSKRLRSLVREGDVLARLGGDEFALIGSFADVHDARMIADRLRQAAARPFRIDGICVQVGASIGVAFQALGTATPDALMKASDLALYEAKKGGRNTVVVFSEPMVQKHTERITIKRDLTLAIGRNEIAVYYRPLVNMRAQKIVGYDASMRWESPSRGCVAPRQLVPLAEESGIIVELGRHILKRATQDVCALSDDASVSVGTFPAQFTKSHLVADVIAALNESGLAPSRLVLEVPERLFCDDESAVSKTLGELSDLGVALALEDLGSPRSALCYLTRYPFARVKLAPAITAAMAGGIGSNAAGKAVFSVAAALSIPIAAESEADAELLATLAGCHSPQTNCYILEQPKPIEALRPVD